LRSAREPSEEKDLEDPEKERSHTRWLWFALAAFAILRIVYGGLHELTPDEAYYWVWSRYLAACYLDHPPMVAVAIWLSTLLFGTSEFSVRLPAALFSVAAVAVTLRLAWIVSGNRRVMLWTGIILLCSPLMSVLGTIITPDSPATFFSICALWAAVSAVRNPHSAWWRWPAFGLLAGLAMTSKYTTVLVPGAVVLMLLTSASGRAHLARPWIWLSAVTAAIGFSPVIWWNATHQWRSFAFQLAHGTRDVGTNVLNNLGEYVGGQTLVWTPILFVLSIVVLVRCWRRLRELPDDQRLLLGCSTLILVFFGIFSARHPAEANWPAFAYLPLTILLAIWGVAAPDVNKALWLRKGVILAAAITILLHVPEVVLMTARVTGKSVARVDDMFGWRELAQKVDAVRGDRVVVCNRYGDAAELSFYMAGRPTAWAFSFDGDGVTAFSAFDGFPDITKLPAVLAVTKEAWHMDKFFPNHTAEQVELKAYGHVLRKRYLISASR
jgi:4-amino-4-deoxy-L-arabinose transferase-like glycosyltransferase